MTDPQSNPFGAFMPGWDFLQQLGKAAAPAPAGLPGWVAPTLSVEDLEKRIQELKTVQYWLEQNGRMLGATIQALEVQKMTLSTLKTMNVHVDEMAESLKVKPEDFMNSWAMPSAGKDKPGSAAPEEPAEATNNSQAKRRRTPKPTDAAPSPADPVQWWGAVSEQFQEIARTAAKDWQHHAAKAQDQMVSAQSQFAEGAKSKPKQTASASAAKRASTTRKAPAKSTTRAGRQSKAK